MKGGTARHDKMETFFPVLRWATGLLAALAILILLVITLLRSFFAFAKEGLGAIGYIATLFTSVFTKGTPPVRRGWVVERAQVGLVVLFAAMIVSSFRPGGTMVLHLVAVIWYVQRMRMGLLLEIFCLPVLPVWFLYYGVCIFWSDRLPISGFGN